MESFNKRILRKRVKKVEYFQDYEEPQESEKVIELLSYSGQNITSLDYASLSKDQMITDGIVNLFVSIQSEGFLREQQNKFHLFDSIFYSLLTGRVIPNRQNQIQLSSAERRYQNVADITAGVSIFEKDFLIFPICVNQHWVLAVICFPHQLVIELEDEKVKCCILYFDSSYSEQRKNRVCDHLRDYLEIEYKQRNFEDREINNRTIEAISVEVLQQDDTVSCGLHLILILERFLMTPLNYVDEPVSTIEWFDELDVIQKRESMAKVVETLIVACNPAMVDSIPKIQLPTLDGEIITVNSPQKTVKKFCMKENKIR